MLEIIPKYVVMLIPYFKRIPLLIQIMKCRADTLDKFFTSMFTKESEK